jgi:hypothetical protein
MQLSFAGDELERRRSYRPHRIQERRRNPTKVKEEPMTQEHLNHLRRDLRDCFEGCIPFHEAIQMIGAADLPERKTLQADWRRWKRAMKV